MWNLDIKGVQGVEGQLNSYKGAVILVSHDRALIDAVCTKILEIDPGEVTAFDGNYSQYKMQKEAKVRRQHFEYEQYVKEKERLRVATLEKSQRARAMKKAPSRMGNSEARLHRRAAEGKRAKLERSAKGFKRRGKAKVCPGQLTCPGYKSANFR